MDPIFEANYIAIDWYDKNTVLKITEDVLPIPVTIENRSTYSMELQTYTRIKNGLDGQVAFHILDADNTIEPYFIDASGKKKLLLKIVDPLSNRIWWIENGKWHGKGKYRDAPLWNHIGDAQIFFNDIICNINIRAITFTKEELELYLSDFKNDFWYLILKDDSITQGDAKNKKIKLFNDESIKLISKFIDNSEKILKNPKKELREIQGIKDIKKVKPVTKTFMEIATSGFRKKLTSRDTVESYNVAENRYIVYAIKRVYTIISHMLNASGHMNNIYEKKHAFDLHRLNTFSDKKIIDKEVFKNEIIELQTICNKELPILHESIFKQNRQIDISNFQKEIVIIRLGKRTNNENIFEFFGDIKQKSSEEFPSFKDGKYQGSFYMISFNKDIFQNKLKSGYEYEVTGYVSKKDIQRENQHVGFKLKRDFIFISNIKIIKSKSKENLDLYIEDREKMEALNWEIKLSTSELKEQDFEKKALKQSINLLKNQQESNFELISHLEFKLTKLKKLLNKYKKLGVKQNSYFPNSMTFIQNPNYQGAHRFYQKIKNIIGIDESLFVQLESVEKIGLQNITVIYERWCLLQIVKVLIDKYNFIPEENWKNKLAKQIIGNPNKIRNVKIKFNNHSINRDIDLWYEKILDNKRRPDFVLDIMSTFGTNSKHRLVMDAKFHENVNIKCLINGLYPKLDKNNITLLDDACPKDDGKIIKKDYSENNNNSVFILHPDINKSIKNKRTPKKWATNAYYGEVEMFNYEWDDKYPNHKYGSILLTPIIKDGNYLDNLQRLIGMSMQYSLEENINIRENNLHNPEPKEKLFCLVCGSADISGSRNLTKSKKGYRYNFTCNKCKHVYVYNYCWNCNNRLIKNGEYWSYHSAQVLKPFDIKCPACNKLLEERNI